MRSGCRGDSTMASYWNKHEATKSALSGEWIRTGDKYSQEAEGFYVHSGRSDDMIKAGGIWVSPVEVEAALIRHPSVVSRGLASRELLARIISTMWQILESEQIDDGEPF